VLFSVFKQPNLDVVSSTEQPPPGPNRNAAEAKVIIEETNAS